MSRRVGNEQELKEVREREGAYHSYRTLRSRVRPSNLRIRLGRDRRRKSILSSDEAAEHLSRRKDFISNVLQGFRAVPVSADMNS
jgi:hypothetical protein